MDSQLLALKLVLDALGVEPDVSNLRERKRLQKAVYLAQVAGVDLSYRHSWYLRGPYSPPLTRDYFALDQVLAAGDETHKHHILHPDLINRLHPVVPLMKSPIEGLDDPEWLELLASAHYLIKVRGESPGAAYKTILDKKSNLAPYWEKALEVLKAQSLL